MRGRSTVGTDEGAGVPAENLARIGTHPLRPEGEPRVNPGSFEVSLRLKSGTDQQLLYPGAERRQSMRGFEDGYVDIVDSIVRATHRIWEEKDTGCIYDHYRHNIPVADEYGMQHGRDKVIANTIQFNNAFPDIRPPAAGSGRRRRGPYTCGASRSTSSRTAGAPRSG